MDHLKSHIVMDDEGPIVFHKVEKLTDLAADIPPIDGSVTYYGTAEVRLFEMMNVFSCRVADSYKVRNTTRVVSVQ